MKVILLEKYKKLGTVGEVVDVKNGFARNYLIPNGKAVQATKPNISSFVARKTELLEQSKKNEEEANQLAKKVKGKIVPVLKQAGDDGRLYGAVNSSEIAEGLNKIVATELARKHVILNYSIKFIGFYQIDIDLGEGVFTDIFLNVARSAGEAEERAKKFKAGEIQLATSTTDLVSSAATITEKSPTEAVVSSEMDSADHPAEQTPEDQPAA